MDDEKRGIYDRYGEDGLKQNAGGGGNPFHDPFDIFSHFFGGGNRQRQQQENRGPDVVVPLEVTLEDLFNGANIEVDVAKQVLCDHCHGTGARRPEDIDTCETCGGHGMIIKRVQMGPGMVQQFQQHCNACGGKGKTIKHVCPACAGKKVRRGNENYTIRIEKGMEDGQSIVSKAYQRIVIKKRGIDFGGRIGRIPRDNSWKYCICYQRCTSRRL